MLRSEGMSEKKKKRFGADAQKLVAVATETWQYLEKNSSTAISKNACVACLPEVSIVVGSMDENSVLPGLLQLAFKPEIKDAIRAEVDSIIGSANPADADAKAAGLKDRQLVDPKLGNQKKNYLGKMKPI